MQTFLSKDTKRVADLHNEIMVLIRSEDSETVIGAALSLTLLEFVKSRPDPNDATRAMRAVFEHLLDFYDEPPPRPRSATRH
jgi:hypothetical protein